MGDRGEGWLCGREEGRVGCVGVMWEGWLCRGDEGRVGCVGVMWEANWTYIHVYGNGHPCVLCIV